MTFEGIDYFSNDIKDVDPNFLSINKVFHKKTGIAIHEIKYIMMQSINNKNIDREVPLTFSDVDGYVIKESKTKFLILALAEHNRSITAVQKTME